MRKLVASLAALCALAWPAAAQKETLRVPFWVHADVASAGRAPSAEELRVQAGSEPAAVLRVLGPEDGLLLLLVTDLAGSLTHAQLAKRALGDSIGRLPDHVRVALLRSQDGLKVVSDPTAEREQLRAAVESVPVSGRAGLLETVQAAANLGDAILAKAAVRVAVLYITDSEIGNYREDFTNPTINSSDSGDVSRRFRDGLIRDRIARLDAALSATETPVFIVHLNYRTDSLNQAYQTGLMTLAATTGGESYFCRSQAEIAESIARAFEAVASQHSAVVEMPPPPLPRFLEITMESPGRTLSWRNRFSVENGTKAAR